jgi:hypothetical protein
MVKRRELADALHPAAACGISQEPDRSLNRPAKPQKSAVLVDVPEDVQPIGWSVSKSVLGSVAALNTVCPHLIGQRERLNALKCRALSFASAHVMALCITLKQHYLLSSSGKRQRKI